MENISHINPPTVNVYMYFMKEKFTEQSRYRKRFNLDGILNGKIGDVVLPSIWFIGLL